jgi:hypothetical protein
VLPDDVHDIDVLFDAIEITGHQAKYRARLALPRFSARYRWPQPEGMKIEAYVSSAYRSVMPAT